MVLFVFLRSPKDGLHSYVFPLAVLLAEGSGLTLTPLYLDIYRQGSMNAREASSSRSVIRRCYVLQLIIPLDLLMGEDWSTVPHAS